MHTKYKKEWDELCNYCDGSGEGRHEGLKCMNCQGLGVEKPEEERIYEDY